MYTARDTITTRPLLVLTNSEKRIIFFRNWSKDEPVTSMKNSSRIKPMKPLVIKPDPIKGKNVLLFILCVFAGIIILAGISFLWNKFGTPKGFSIFFNGLWGLGILIIIWGNHQSRNYVICNNAKKAYSNGDFLQGNRLFQRAIRRSLLTRKSIYIDRIFTSFHWGDHETVKQDLKKIHPRQRSLEIQYIQGIILQNENQEEQAIKLFQDLEEKGFVTALFSLGEIYFSKQEFEQSREYLIQFQNYNSQEIRCYYYLGIIEKELGNTDSSFQYFSALFSVEPYFQDNDIFMKAREYMDLFPEDWG